MENFKVLVDSLTRANKALRDVIEEGADEVGQLEKFEDRFKSTKEHFFQFKQIVIRNNHQADEVILSLEQTLLDKRRNADDLARQVAKLKHAINEQNAENQKLQRDINNQCI